MVYKQKPKIVINERLKKILDGMKIYPRETYEDIIDRLIKDNKQKKSEK